MIVHPAHFKPCQKAKVLATKAEGVGRVRQMWRRGSSGAKCCSDVQSEYRMSRSRTPQRIRSIGAILHTFPLDRNLSKGVRFSRPVITERYMHLAKVCNEMMTQIPVIIAVRYTLFWFDWSGALLCQYCDMQFCYALSRNTGCFGSKVIRILRSLPESASFILRISPSGEPHRHQRTIYIQIVMSVYDKVIINVYTHFSVHTIIIPLYVFVSIWVYIIIILWCRQRYTKCM